MTKTRLYDHLISRRDVLNWAGRSAAFASVLAATRSLPAVAEDAPTLRIWITEDYVPAWNNYLPIMVKKVAAEMGINAKLELTPDNDTGRARRQTALESDTFPDILHATSSDSAKYYNLGKLHPVAKDVFERMSKTNGGWLEGVESFVTAADGNLYGIPFITRPWLVHYRQDLLDKAGFKTLPKTMDEFKAAAQAIHNPSEGIYGAGMPYNQQDMDGHMIPFSWLYNGSWQDAHGKLTVDTPENLAALKSYLWFFQQGLSPQDSLNWGGVGNNNAYLTGLAGIVCNTGSLFAALQRDRPDLAEVTTLGPWPQAVPDGKPAATTIGFCLNIAHNSPHAELAGQFIEKMLDVENMGPLLEAGSGQAMPVRKNLTEIEYFQKDPIVGKIVKDVVPFSRPSTWPGPNNAPYADLVSNNSPYFKDMLHRVLVSNVTPEESLKQFAAEGEALTKKYTK